MAFIAVNAKADIIGSKKGKITPAQNAVINAWSLSKKTGIFNLGEGYRCEAQVGNIVGNQQEIVFNRGYFVVYGRLVEIEQGTTILVDLGDYEGRIVAKFNLLASQEGEFQVVAQRKNVVLANQNLNINPTGECDFVLYDYQATTSSVSLDTRDNSIYIEDVGGIFDGTNVVHTAKNFDKTDNTGNIYKSFAQIGISNYKGTTAVAPLNGYDRDKGTIEQRLTSLGFKQGSITGWNNSGVTLEKTGKFAILRLPEGEPKIVTDTYTDLQMFVDGTTPLKSNETLTFALNGTNFSATISVTKGSNIARIYSSQYNNYIRPFSLGFKIQ